MENKKNLLITFVKSHPKLIASIFNFSNLILFILLDYYTFIDIFHFSSSNFLDIYLYSITTLDALYFILTTMLPFIFLLMFFIALNLNILPLTLKYNFIIINKPKNNKLNLVLLTILLLHIFLIISSIIVYIFIDKYINNFILISLLLSLPIIFAFSVTMFILTKLYPFIKRVFSNNDFTLFIFLFYIPILLPFYILYYNNIYVDYLFFLMIIYIFMFFTLLYIHLIFERVNHKKRKEKQKYIYSIISSLVFIYIMFFFYTFDNANSNIWKNKDSNHSWNLFINKLYESPNHTIIDINATYYDNNTSKIEPCWNNKKKYIHLDSNQTTYLPISKEMKLYFKKQDENLTCVYAINKKFYKNQYNYILQDIGYIDTKKGEHE